MSSPNCNICSNKCYGIDGYAGSCCTIEDRDYIIGPHADTDEFIQRLKEKTGLDINKEDVFIEYEEGKRMFPEKPSWQNPQSYPALRIDLYHPKKPCVFYNTRFKFCTVYDIRPKTCENYECDYLKSVK